MKITILTLFPQMFSGPFDYSIVKRAIEKNLVEIEIVDIRDFGLGKHKTVDDKPYGGGHGMILRADVLKEAIDFAKDKSLSKDQERIILTSASAQIFTQEKAFELSNYKHLIIVCGHYEGVDERVMNFIDEEISIGKFVLTGGEIPAIAITDSIVRLVKGVLKDDVTKLESYSGDLLEHGQYTRPRTIDKLSVPETLLSGDHEEIKKWKEKQSIAKTKALVEPKE